MTYGQYCRIETKAGGVGCSDREFIRAALYGGFLTHGALSRATLG